MKEAYVLKELLENDERIIRLKKDEKEMENSEEVMRLSYAFSCAQNEYNDILKHFKTDSDEAKKYQRKLYEAKKNLDSHPLVKKYLQSYQEVRLVYNKIQDEIFKPFIAHECKEKR
ncbi:MAG: YlbF family regulator [Erysipelotrichales bacterium]|nr:YlbF family regulator [Erysipelotrichales bacterium]